MATGQRRGSRDGQNAQISSPFPHADILRDIQQEWNKAESAIKRSEQIAKSVSIPAITELRYAGRRLVDALDAAHHGGNETKILALLEDARFCCHRAQHDAIDAAMAKIGIDLDDLTSRLGFEAVIHAYPEFREFYADFTTSRTKIVSSRENRDDRNGIYEAITAVDLPNLVTRYEKVLAVRPIAKHTAFRLKISGIWGVLIGLAAILGCIFAGLAVDWNNVGGGNSKEVTSQSAKEDASK
jgi:hypothetical protein